MPMERFTHSNGRAYERIILPINKDMLLHTYIDGATQQRIPIQELVKDCDVEIIVIEFFKIGSANYTAALKYENHPYPYKTGHGASEKDALFDLLLSNFGKEV